MNEYKIYVSTTYARKSSLHEVLKRFREGEDRTEMGSSFRNLGKETKIEIIVKSICTRSEDT